MSLFTSKMARIVEQKKKFGVDFLKIMSAPVAEKLHVTCRRDFLTRGSCFRRAFTSTSIPTLTASSMLQNASAKARICARRTFSRGCKASLSSCNRPLIVRQHGDLSPILLQSNPTCSQRRLLGMDIISRKTPVTVKGREARIKVEDEDADMMEIPSHDEGKALKSEHSPKVRDELEVFVKGEPIKDLQSSLLNSHFEPQETIYALSTGTGSAAIAVIRISGPACKQVCYLNPRAVN